VPSVTSVVKSADQILNLSRAGAEQRKMGTAKKGEAKKGEAKKGEAKKGEAKKG
jgi:hypothetical protein